MIKKKYNIFLILMYCVIPIDLITGSILILDSEASPLIGKLLKFLILFYILFNVMKLNRVVIFSIISLFFITIIEEINGEVYEFFVDILEGSKIFLFIFIYYLLHFLLLKNILKNNYIERLFFFSFLLIFLNQILGLFGFGKPTYFLGNISIGTSGFFFESNAYGFVVLIIEAFLLLNILQKNKIIFFLIFSVIFIITGFTIATKLAIFGSLIVPLIILFNHNKKLFLLTFCLIITFLIVKLDNADNFVQFEKVLNTIDSDGIESGFFSGRDERFIKAYNDYFQKFSLTEKLIGIGRYRMINDKIVSGTSEMDFMDILKMSGFVGFLIVYSVFLFVCFKLIKNYYNHKIIEFKTVFMLNLFFVLGSTFGGHLFTSGTPTIFLAFLNIYPYVIINNQKNKNIEK